MILHSVLEAAFGSPAKIRILRVLLTTPQPLSGRQVGELARLSHRGAIQALTSLVELGAVRQRRVGKAYQYSLYWDNAAVKTIIAPCIKAEAALMDDLKINLTTQFGKNAMSLTLYGSLARGMEKRGSDIDVLAVANDDRTKLGLEEKAATLVPFYRELYNTLLSLHCFTLNELKKKKNSPLIKSVIQEGILISGKPLGELI
jgi:predicted nucleotidyltransferase